MPNDSPIAPRFDFIVCGSGSSGAVVARRLAESSQVSVLLLEAGGSDDVPEVNDPLQWPSNLGSERDWGFVPEPSSALNGRSLSLSMGKVLGGGSAINAVTWARGHRNDWEHYAAETLVTAWEYEAVLDVYRHIEDWHGVPDARRRGVGGPLYVQTAPNPHPLAAAAVAGALSVGIPSYDSHNGAMMEGDGGASLLEMNVRDGRRQSIFRSYVAPYLDRPNLTLLTDALVTRVTFDNYRATGIQFVHGGTVHTASASGEVILSLGAVHTPKVLMQSGLGAADELSAIGIPIVTDLPGVGKNYQDHPRIAAVWEFKNPLPPQNNGAEATAFWKSDPSLDEPNVQMILGEFPITSRESATKYSMPERGWSVMASLVRPKSRGCIRLTGPRPSDPVAIDANMLSHPDDVDVALAAVEMCRALGNSLPMRSFAKREVLPGRLTGNNLVGFIRDSAESFFHHSGTAKMGRDHMSVVDGTLQVHEIEGLRVADASVLPRVTTGNTMAPCVVVGERAAEFVKRRHGL